MDIRGIEVTNQLRSAIRAKLLELGVRYDEELPDYILVMVVNKKTRQQMHEDLNLFLEDSTTPFVEWLHDQVLKKLQKVTIAKKKASREFVPTVVVKQEEERKKRKNAAAAAEEASVAQVAGKIVNFVAKEEKSLEKNVEKSSEKNLEKSSEKNLEKSLEKNLENSSEKNLEKSWEKNLEKSSLMDKNVPDIADTPVDRTLPPSAIREIEKIIPTKIVLPEATEGTKSTASVAVPEKPSDIVAEARTVESHAKTTTMKRSLEIGENSSDRPDKRVRPLADPDASKEQDGEEEEDENETRDDKKMKSCVNKPKITSVVSVKNRLGIVSPRKKFETHRNRDIDFRHGPADKRFEKNTFEANRFDKNPFESLNRRGNVPREKSHEDEDSFSRNRSNDARNRQAGRANETRNRLGTARDDTKFVKNSDSNDKSVVAASRLRNVEKQGLTVKDRLGINKSLGVEKQSTTVEDSPMRNLKNTIKNRLGPVRNQVRVTNSHVGFVPAKKRLETRLEDDNTNMEADDDQDDDQSVINVGPVKSHIIAVKRPVSVDKRAGMKMSGKIVTEVSKDPEDDGEAEGGKSIASKVIVTPRPLKPLQPTQKRATQSLLLRAVAEANQSVVKQKNPEPALSDKKPKLKRLKPPGTREMGKNLSVHLNATKRLVMERIQVQLRTADMEDSGKSKPYIPHPVNDEHMGVVMSLFQRSDDNQKFLVTLNGYNNNVIKDKTMTEEDEERLEMEVTEDDELVLSTVQNDSYEQNESSPTPSQIIETEDNEVIDKVITDENNENHNSENVEIPEEVTQRKRRKLSPIVYSRSRSSSPLNKAMRLQVLPASVKDSADKTSVIDVPLSTVTDESREKCRYWPNCTLGSKCAYYHPAVLCSAFPACKFGDKCAYKHPKCKFGLSCTKLGCAFSHPKQQCKYHPFCTKPTCPYSHPSAHPVVAVADATRAKFTWRRRD